MIGVDRVRGATLSLAMASLAGCGAGDFRPGEVLILFSENRDFAEVYCWKVKDGRREPQLMFPFPEVGTRVRYMHRVDAGDEDPDPKPTIPRARVIMLEGEYEGTAGFVDERELRRPPR